MSVWVRTVQAGLTWTSGSSLIASVPRGSTLVRTHFAWGFNGNTRSSAAAIDTSDNIQVMGIVTTVGNGTETVPNARTAAGDAAPPTKRWIYWEGRAPNVVAWPGGEDLALWADSGPQAPVDTKGMVSAKTIAAGNTLNVWASWAAGGVWEANGQVNLWYWASLLYQ